MGSVPAQETKEIIYTSMPDVDKQSYEVKVTMEEDTISYKNHRKDHKEDQETDQGEDWAEVRAFSYLPSLL